MQGLVEARYDGKIAEDAYCRVYGRWLDLAGTDMYFGRDSCVGWDPLRGGAAGGFRPG